jgi:hypothetical protein
MHEYDGHLLYHPERGSIESRQNWDSPNPSPAGECAPPPDQGGGAHSLTKDGLGESQFRRGDIHCGTLYKYVLCSTGRILSLFSCGGCGGGSHVTGVEGVDRVSVERRGTPTLTKLGRKKNTIMTECTRQSMYSLVCDII